MIHEFLEIIGVISLLLVAWKGSLAFYRRTIQKPKHPTEFGKWAVVTGSTSGIGKEFALQLAKLGMPVLLISRCETKLQEQAKELKSVIGKEVKFIAYDFTVTGEEQTIFYDKLDVVLKEIHEDGGIGVLVNNVGVANQYPQSFEEFNDKQIVDMINCNIYSTIWMTKAVLKYMKMRSCGCVINISSGSCNDPSPYIVIYSATKAFITQFSRSMKVEYWDSGIDFLAVTPFYIVSNLYRKNEGTLYAPMPIKLVEGTFAQLGKKWIWQGHGYWFHGLLGFLGWLGGNSARRRLQNMLAHRKKYAEKMARNGSGISDRKVD